MVAGLAHSDRGTAAFQRVLESNNEGVRLLLAEKPREAAAHFEKARLAIQVAGLSDSDEDSVLVRRHLAAALAEISELERRDGQIREAIRLLTRAIDLHPERVRYRILRGRAYFETGIEGDRLSAAEEFAAALERDPDHVDALFNLGEIEYSRRRLEEAVRHWERAARLRPNDAEIARRLEKARRERDVEESYAQRHSGRFLLRYAPAIKAAQAAEVLQLCEQAYGKLAARFDSWLDSAIVVTLYTPEEFRSATRMHGWVSGLSDGTIRLTMRPDTRAAELKPTIYHELTHHLIRARAKRVPVWLHEGLAQREEGKSVAAARRRLQLNGRIDERVLSSPVLQERDPRRVSHFYDLALAFTTYLDERRGSGILEVLTRLAEDPDEAAALRVVYGATRTELFEAFADTLARR